MGNLNTLFYNLDEEENEKSDITPKLNKAGDIIRTGAEYDIIDFQPEKQELDSLLPKNNNEYRQSNTCTSCQNLLGKYLKLKRKYRKLKNDYDNNLDYNHLKIKKNQ